VSGGALPAGAASHHDDVALLTSHVEHVIECRAGDNCPVGRDEGTSVNGQCEVRDEMAADLRKPNEAASRSPRDRRQPGFDASAAYGSS